MPGEKPRPLRRGSRKSWFGAATALLWALACGADAERLPTAYAAVVVPDSVGSAAARARGRELFLEHCVLCHGARADGRGVRRDSLDPKPRDYGDPSWRRRATPRSVYFAVSEGVPNTAMPSWETLTRAERWDLVSYVLSVAADGP